MINNNLQEIYNKIQCYCNLWKLKINSNKCETILLRPRLSEGNRDTKRHCNRSFVKSYKNHKNHNNR